MPRLALAIAALALGACTKREDRPAAIPPASAIARDAAVQPQLDEWAEARFAMVDNTVAARGISDERVLAALRTRRT